MNGIVTSRVPLMKATALAMSDHRAHDGNLKTMLARQWNVAPSIDHGDILGVEFETYDDHDFPYVAVTEVAYGHRMLADFILDHWKCLSEGAGFIRDVNVSAEDDDMLWVMCTVCSKEIFLDKQSLKGMGDEQHGSEEQTGSDTGHAGGADNSD